MAAGVLAVVRNHPEWERPYTGIVELASGEIAEDLAKYLVESEQQNAAIALGVSIGRDLEIRAAGGFLIQVASEIHPTLFADRDLHCSPPFRSVILSLFEPVGSAFCRIAGDLHTFFAEP